MSNPTPTHPTSNPAPATPSEGSTATAEKQKRARKSATNHLYYTSKDANEIGAAIKAGVKILIELPSPPGVEKAPSNRKLYKACAKVALSEVLKSGKQSPYNNREIHLVSVHDTFKFNAAVKVKESRDVEVTES